MNGIYKIENLVNAKVYIGSSQCLHGRKKTHWSQLRTGRHGNSYLQAAWNKYGEANFVFSVIFQDVPLGNLTTIEQEEINKAKAGGISVYNLRVVADSQRGIKLGPMPACVIAKISASRLGIEPWNKGVKYKLTRPRRAPSGGELMFASRTHCPAGHAYDTANTLVRNDQRQCRACARRRSQIRRILNSV